jgi:hypothetical protein
VQGCGNDAQRDGSKKGRRRTCLTESKGNLVSKNTILAKKQTSFNEPNVIAVDLQPWWQKVTVATMDFFSFFIEFKESAHGRNI